MKYYKANSMKQILIMIIFWGIVYLDFANSKTRNEYTVYMLSFSVGYTGAPLNLTASYFYNTTYFDR